MTHGDWERSNAVKILANSESTSCGGGRVYYELYTAFGYNAHRALPLLRLVSKMRNRPFYGKARSVSAVGNFLKSTCR